MPVRAHRRFPGLCGFPELPLFFTSPVASGKTLADMDYSVLVVHFYHQGYAWTDRVSPGTLPSGRWQS
ncbi:MAG: hypothetical protein APR53_01920 [Methanoculleus sp. SDB]|nr:MAG: hypothetical protein APR53_01920 [Methanoculleus sp. SDB]